MILTKCIDKQLTLSINKHFNFEIHQQMLKCVDIYNILLFAQLPDDIGPHEGLNLTFNQRSYLLLIKSKCQGIQKHVTFDIFPQWLRVELNLQLMLHFKTLKMSTYTRTNLFDICSHWGLNSNHWVIEAMRLCRWLYLFVNLFKIPLIVDIFWHPNSIIYYCLHGYVLDDICPPEGLNATFNQWSCLLLIS